MNQCIARRLGLRNSQSTKIVIFISALTNHKSRIGFYRIGLIRIEMAKEVFRLRLFRQTHITLYNYTHLVFSSYSCLAICEEKK